MLYNKYKQEQVSYFALMDAHVHYFSERIVLLKIIFGLELLYRSTNIIKPVCMYQSVPAWTITYMVTLHKQHIMEEHGGKAPFILLCGC